MQVLRTAFGCLPYLVEENSPIIHIEECSHNWPSPSNLVDEHMLGRKLKDLLDGIDGKDK
jgi:hypothetical protein